MKKLLLVLTITIFCTATIAFARPFSELKLNEDKCEYSASRFNSDAQKFAFIGFAPRNTFDNDKLKMGYMIYHNPFNLNENSMDLIELVLLDENEPDKKIILMAVYTGKKRNIVFNRDVKNKKLSNCFTRTVVNKPNK